jgi:hypothetical protein
VNEKDLLPGGGSVLFGLEERVHAVPVPRAELLFTQLFPIFDRNNFIKKKYIATS